MGVLATIGTTVKAATAIPKKLQDLGKAEFAEPILNLLQGVNDLTTECLELKKQLQNANEELRKIRNIAQIKQELKYKNDCYWDNDGHPICSACLEKPIDPASIRMHTEGRDDGFVTCPVCKNTARSKGAQPIESSVYYNHGDDIYE